MKKIDEFAWVPIIDGKVFRDYSDGSLFVYKEKKKALEPVDKWIRVRVVEVKKKR